MVKIVTAALVCSIIIIYLKSINSALAMLATIGAGIILIFFVLNYVLDAFKFINNIIELSGLDKEYYLIIFKITAIGYLVEFGADTITDFGLKSVADKLIFAGKIIIFATSLPVIYAIINLLVGILQ